MYTGSDTKIIQNSKKPPSKESNVLKKMNKILYSVFAFQITLCLVFGAFSIEINSSLVKHSYLDVQSINSPTNYIIQVLTFWVAYSHLIPISLYVALEVLKLTLAFLINEDLDMYYNETPAKCKSSDLVEELGQVEFIFSDKTGTLTCNEMVFRKCMVNGLIYGTSSADFGRTDSPEYMVLNYQKSTDHYKLEYFFKFLTICNSVFPSLDADKNIVYQSSSPDELALVNISKKLGIQMIDRIDGNIYIEIGKKTEF